MRSVSTPNPHPPSPCWPTRPTTTTLKQHFPHLTTPPHVLWTWPTICSLCRHHHPPTCSCSSMILFFRVVFPLFLDFSCSFSSLCNCFSRKRSLYSELTKLSEVRTVKTAEGSIRSIHDPYYTRVERIDVLTYWAGCRAYRVSRLPRIGSFRFWLFYAVCICFVYLFPHELIHSLWESRIFLSRSVAI